MISNSRILLLLLPVLSVLFIGIGSAYGQTAGNTFYPRIEIWALFYRLMVIAFVIGAVIMGIMFYTVWRFRESNPRNKNLPVKSRGSHDH